jgi:hypothetical protein
MEECMTLRKFHNKKVQAMWCECRMKEQVGALEQRMAISKEASMSRIQGPMETPAARAEHSLVYAQVSRDKSLHSKHMELRTAPHHTNDIRSYCAAYG